MRDEFKRVKSLLVEKVKEFLCHSERSEESAKVAYKPQ